MSTEGLTRFLNVDLELVSTHDIRPLLAHWSDETLTLRDSVEAGRCTVWLELARDPPDADNGVRDFASLVEALPRDLRQLWDSCDDRCLNVGVQSADDPDAAAFRISASAIRALAAISARLEFTVYASGTRSERRRPPGRRRSRRP